MVNPLAKDWECMMSSLDRKIEGNANPKVQIMQAAKAERQHHQEIQRQAAAVIGSRNQLEMQLGRLTSERDRITENARRVLANADQARAKDDEATAQKMEGATEVFATQLMNVEKELGNTMQPHQQAVSTTEEARRQTQQSQARYEQIKQDIRKSGSQADQTKIQEAMPKTLQGTQDISGDPNVPTLDSVREKIEGRYANTLGAQGLMESSQAGRMAETKTPTHDAVVDIRLVEIRTQMNNESATLKSGSAAKDNAGELESAESVESVEAVEDTTADADETEQPSPVVNNHQQESVEVYGSSSGEDHRQGQVVIVS